MSRIFFMTTHGTLLTGGDTPAHRPFRDIAGAAALFSVDADIDALRPPFAAAVTGAHAPPVRAGHDGLGEISLLPQPDRNLVALERAGEHLSAGPHGGTVVWTAGEPQDWEWLLPLTEAELGHLVAIFSNHWLVRSTRALVRPWQVALRPGHALAIGELVVPLARNLPFIGEHFPFRLSVLVDGWRLDEIVLFKPLVFSAAFGSPAVHEQLFLMLASLREFGGYEGHVHLLTDLAPERIHEAVPSLTPDRTSVQPLSATDFAGFVLSKYAVLEHAPAWGFQPLLFLDPDIVANTSLLPLLTAAALADRLTAPIEDVGPLRSWPPVGGTLLQRDNREARFARGFNAGTLGIPNLRAHEGTLRLIRRIAANLLQQEGRDSLEWVDQEVANYVAFLRGAVDTAAISPFVRYGAPHTSETPGPRTGLVHFWATGKNGREEIMRNYIEVLREHGRHAHKLS